MFSDQYLIKEFDVDKKEMSPLFQKLNFSEAKLYTLILSHRKSIMSQNANISEQKEFKVEELYIEGYGT